MRFFNRDKQDAMRVVVIGAGQVGFHIAQRLAMEMKQVVVIDQDEDALKRISEHMDVQTIHGSGSSPIILDQAGAGSADIILAVTDSDEINIIACMFANVLSSESLKLARIRNEEYSLFQEALRSDALGIGMVINPEVEVVKTIERLITVPGALEFNEFADGRIKMVGIRLYATQLSGTKLKNLRDKVGDLGVIIAAIVRDERLVIPTGDDVIRDGDLIYFVCDEDRLDPALAAFGIVTTPTRNVMIIGGGNIGLKVANLFESKGFHTKLVEGDIERCDLLAQKLNKTVVLRGDGTDQDFLTEENVGDMDVVVSVTGDEETNILTSLLAKSLGAAKTITRINKFAYMPLVRAIGIEHSVSPRLSAINSVLRFVRRGKVLSSISIKGEEAEAMEAVAEKGSEIVGKPIMDLKFPRGALILCIIRKQGDALEVAGAPHVEVPHGGSVINPGDRIIILATRQTISKVEKVLEAKLEHL